jgi:hypothetical protein
VCSLDPSKVIISTTKPALRSELYLLTSREQEFAISNLALSVSVGPSRIEFHTIP